jgi:signal transduction histidine kinase
MNTSTRLALTLAVISCFGALLVATVQRAVLSADYTALQERKATDDLQRSRERVIAELESLGSTTSDWAFWDDTYGFVQDKNPKYADINLRDTIFDTTSVEYLCMINRAGRVVFQRTQSPDGLISSEIKGFNPLDLNVNELVERAGAKPSKVELRAVINTSSGPFALSARPILTSDKAGPFAGTLIFGKYLTANDVHRVSEQLRVPFQLVTQSLVSGKVSRAGKLFSPKSAKDVYVGLVPLPNATSYESVYVKSETVPDIAAGGQAAMRWTTISLLFLAFLTALASILASLNLVTLPLAALAKGLDRAQLRTGLQIKPSLLARRDEVGTLAQALQAMVNRMDNYQQKLILSSRESGMAQVAKGILHNAGNVLNSISVSTAKLQEAVPAESAPGLSKASKMLDDLASSNDLDAERERLRKLSRYLEECDTVARERDAVLRAEIQSLAVAVECMSTVIDAHQVLSSRDYHTVEVSIDRAVDAAAGALEPALAADGIKVQTSHESIDVVTIDETRFAQIISNLLTNAGHALRKQPMEDRRIEIKTSFNKTDCTVVVEDTGVGMDAETLARIFENGFSTKGPNRGFGLHYCATTAMEMGGRLTAESDGIGRGSRFILTFPIQGDICLEQLVA